MGWLDERKSRPQVIPGMTLGTLMKVLARNGFCVDPDCLWRLAHLVALGVLNSIYGRCETFFNSEEIDAVQIEQHPLFVIGHWRSGTTHLHNLLSLDDNFNSPTAYQASFPHHFVFSQAGGTIFNWIAPKKRPMDNMAFSSDTPHEDEFALAAHCTISPYMRILFPITGDSAYSELDPERLSRDKLEKWKASIVLFMKKLTLSGSGRIVFKSPPHLGRVATLLEFLPRAQFVHIVRDPYMVYMSTKKLWKDSLGYAHLQVPSQELVDQLILTWYKQLFSLYLRDKDKVPAGQLYEMKFEDLEARPVETLRSMYEELHLPGFDKLEANLVNYLASIKDYRKNVHRLEESDREKVRTHWFDTFERYDYPL
ncbi:MAG: sulfotransferase [Desulfomonile tiedjei]|uniref:Sulfotransferase n=1 Tax=Desulfomonile tiedjei TaxID=2358 RepID=A0A9D6V6P7_9BACT|nr:sulfotransferase [Desulfomonile tiedjei]